MKTVPIQSKFSSLFTLQDFCDYYSLVSYLNPKENMMSAELADISNGSFINREAILSSYSEIDFLENPNLKSQILESPNPPINANAIINVPIESLKRDFISSINSFIYPNANLNAFLVEQNAFILNEVTTTFKSGVNSFVKQVNGCTIWAVCFSVNYPNGVIYNLSAFSNGLSTFVGSNGGKFSFTLPPILGDFLPEISLDFENTNIFSENGNMRFFSKSVQIDSEGKSPIYFFSELLQENDLVFISHLPSKDERRFIPISELYLDANANVRVWDVIGLVDSVKVSEDFNSVNTTINVQGRDLFKLLIDDVTMFFPISTQPVDIGGVFNNATTKPKPLRRLYDNNLNELSAYVDKTIPESLSFILSMISSVEICDSSVFQSFSNISSFLKVTALKPQIVTYTNDAGQIVNDSINVAADIATVPAAGIWGSIKLLVEDDKTQNSLAVRRVVDSSIGNMQGSLLTYFRKIVQSPFAEFWGDTYQSNYSIIVRKPPFTQESYRSLILASDEIEAKSGDFHISPEKVLSTTAAQAAGNHYSWYRVKPYGSFLGKSNELTLSFIPAVFFPEIAEKYGNKAFDVETNYINYKNAISNASNIELTTIQKQCINDLRFVIESNVYVPFSKNRTVVINFDNRYKKGMAVRYLLTDEFYIIDSVQHDSSFTANSNKKNTILTLSRGLVDRVVNGESTFEKYFNLVDLSGDVNTWQINKDILQYFIQKKQFSK